MANTKTMVHQCHCTSISKAEFGLARILRRLDDTGQIVSHLMGSDPDMLHLLRGDLVLLRQIQHGLNTRLSMATGGVHFVISICDGVNNTQVSNHIVRINLLRLRVEQTILSFQCTQAALHILGSQEGGHDTAVCCVAYLYTFGALA